MLPDNPTRDTGKVMDELKWTGEEHLTLSEQHVISSVALLFDVLFNRELHPTPALLKFVGPYLTLKINPIQTPITSLLSAVLQPGLWLCKLEHLNGIESHNR